MPVKRTSVMNEERRRAIVDFVNQNGRALVRELARKYTSSEITIRRDLEHAGKYYPRDDVRAALAYWKITL